MVTHESLKEWLAVQGHPLEMVEDPRTGMPIYVLQQRSDVAKMSTWVSWRFRRAVS